ncbi:MAG: glycosyltransferase family 4 protein, partial [Candidatus Njordarchaeales archaeon]
ALVYGFYKRKPIVRNVDDLWPEVFYELGIVESPILKKILDLLATASYRIPRAITPISSAYKRKILEKYGVRKDKIQVVEVGVDLTELSIASNENEERFVVMYSGILGVGYDFEVVLKAADALSVYEDITFVIRGVGELAGSLKKSIERFNLKNVILDTHFLPKPELTALLSSADVFLLPMSAKGSVEEGLPTKIFEYQALGKPVICCSEGMPARYIEKTKSGIAVKTGDYKALAKAILYLKKNKEIAKEKGNSGRLYVEDNLSVEKIGSKMMLAFNKILMEQNNK